MRTTLAPTTLSIGATDSIKVKDAYDVTGSADNTSVKDMLVGLKDDSVDALRKTPKLAASLTKLVLDAKNGNLNSANAASRLASIFGNRGGVLDNLSTRATSIMADTLGMSPKLAGRVLITAKGLLGGSESILGYSKNATSSQGIVSSIQRLLGDKDIIGYTDLDAEASLLSGILGEAVKAGIPQSVDLLIRQATSEESKQRIISENIYAVVFSGNLATVEKLASYMTPAQIRAKYPNFARDFLGQYTLLPTETTNDYVALKARIIALFAGIDSNWDKALRGAVYVPSLAPFTKASADATKVFTSSATYRSALILAAKYPTVDIKTWIKKSYPYFPA